MGFVATISLFPLIFFVLVVIMICSAEIASAKIPALIAFGDSILDTGNNNVLNTVTKANFPPYGIDFAGRVPTGRFSDGRVFSDVLAEGLGVKSTVPAYLDPNLKDSDLATGVCFASAGSGLDPVTSQVQQILDIGDQLKNFKEYIEKLKRVVGEEEAESIISNAQFLISSGNNDIAISYFFLRLRMQYDLSSYSSMLVQRASKFVQALYELGARKIAYMSTLPLGCLPLARTVAGGFLRICAENMNEAAELFNSKLSSEMTSLSNKFSDADIFFLDVFNPLLDLIQNPQLSGFRVGNNGCCGTGMMEMGIAMCNQLNPFTCVNPSEYVFWDSVHPSEAAYKVIARQVIKKYSENFFAGGTNN